MVRSRFTIAHLLIPSIATLVVIGLGMTQWGALYGRIVTLGSQQESLIYVRGFTKPKIALDIAGKIGGKGEKLIRLTIEERTPLAVSLAGVSLTIPQSWKLREVRGVNAQDIAQEDLGEALQYLSVNAEAKPTTSLALLFSSMEPMGKTVLFSHEGNAPALVSFTEIAFPEKTWERAVELVATSRVFRLEKL